MGYYYYFWILYSKTNNITDNNKIEKNYNKIHIIAHT